MENTSLKVLYLEDSPRDVEIIRELLAGAGYDLRMDHTDKNEEFVSLLRSRSYDIILSDFSLPGFDAFGALQLSIDICPDVPFICVSGSIGEETAIDLIKQGAVDYVLKDRMVRLPLAIKRALDEAKEKDARRRAEENLRTSEHRFQTLAEMSPAGIFQTDAEGSTTYVNPRWCQISGMSREEALGAGWLGAVHTEDKEKLGKGWEKATQVHESSVAEYRFVRKDGTIAWVIGQAIPQEDGDNRIVGYIGTITDITERKQGEEALRESEEKLRRIFENVQDVYYEVALDGTILEIGPSIEILSHGEYRRSDLLGRSMYDFYSDPAQREALLGKLQQHGNVTDFEITLRNRDGSSIPCSISSKILLDSEQKPSKIFGSMRDITERKRVEDSLRVLASRQKAILGAVPDIIVEVDNNKVYTWANQSGIDFFGDDLIGKEAAYYFEGKQDTYNSVRRLFDGAESTIYLESWQRRRDGQKRLLGWWCRVLKDENGNVKGALSTARDITEREQAQIALSESEVRFRNVFEHAGVGKSITSLDGGIRVNNAFCQMVGYSEDELSKLKWQQITHPDDVEHDQETIRSIIAGERDSARWQKRYAHKDGEIVWADVTTVLQRDGAGKPLYFITTVVDITERKRIEEKLSASEVRYRRLFESAKDGILILDAETGMIMDVNPYLIELLGYTHFDFWGKAVWELGLLKDVIANQDKFLELQQQEYVRYENLPLETADGRHINVEFVSNVYLVDHMRVVQCNIRNITERRRAEEKILGQLEELRRWQEVTLGREDRNRQLKHEVNELLVRLGETIRYPSQDSVNKE